MKAFKETIDYVTTEKYRKMDEAVEQVIAECRWGLDRAVSEAMVKF